jgi:hypothetical protein
VGPEADASPGPEADASPGPEADASPGPEADVSPGPDGTSPTPTIDPIIVSGENNLLDQAGVSHTPGGSNEEDLAKAIQKVTTHMNSPTTTPEEKVKDEAILGGLEKEKDIEKVKGEPGGIEAINEAAKNVPSLYDKKLTNELISGQVEVAHAIEELKKPGVTLDSPGIREQLNKVISSAEGIVKDTNEAEEGVKKILESPAANKASPKYRALKEDYDKLIALDSHLLQAKTELQQHIKSGDVAAVKKDLEKIASIEHDINIVKNKEELDVINYYKSTNAVKYFVTRPDSILLIF